MPKVGWIAIEVIGEPLIHRGNPEEHRSARLELADDILRAEGHEHGATASNQRAMQRDSQAVDVEERQRQHEPVFGGPAPGLDHAAPLGKQVAMVEQCSFWASSRAGGIQKESRIFGSERPPTPTLPHKGGGN